MIPASARRVALLLSLACAVPSSASDPAVAWRSWPDGLEQARARKRPVLVNVHTDWCGWCRRMERDVYARPEIRQYLDRKFVTVKLNAESAEPAPYQGEDLTARELASRFRVTGYPTTLFLRSNGEHLVSVPGYVAADRFLLLLRYIGDGHLERGVTWEAFRAKNP